MKILALDTSTALLSISLKNENSYYDICCDEGLKHSERLIPFIDILFNQAQIKPVDLDLIVCALGPGSFTGLRIGLSTAKAMAFAADCPFITVPTLDLYGMDYPFFPGAVVPVIDARKKRFYTAVYQNGRKITDYLDISPAELLNLLEPYDRILFTGPDASSFYSIIHKDIMFDRNAKVGKSRTLLRLGEDLFRQRGHGDPEELGPLYIRKSEAEESRDKKNGN